MIFEELIEEMKNVSDKTQAKKMSDYMKGKFDFLGIPKPKLKKIIKPYISSTRKETIDWDFIFEMWDFEFREAQYVALEYMNVHKKEIHPEDLDKVKRLITTKSWWETVDSLDAFVGDMIIKDLSIKEEMLSWSVSDDIWLRRVSIDCQQRLKEETDTELLEKVIKNNLGSNEFFINKAIGWSLREYSKVNKEWVVSFIDANENELDKLSIREARKYL